MKSQFLFVTTELVLRCSTQTSCFRCSNAYTEPPSSKAPALDLPSCGGLLNDTADGSGPRETLARAHHFTFHFQPRDKNSGEKNMDKLGYILLADDNENDVELEQRALAQYRLANEIVTVRD